MLLVTQAMEKKVFTGKPHYCDRMACFLAGFESDREHVAYSQAEDSSAFLFKQGRTDCCCLVCVARAQPADYV